MLLHSRHGAVTRPILARLAPALLALAATLLLGMAELPMARAWRWFESPALLPVVGVVFAAAAGLLACHLALSSTARRAGPLAAALPAALLAAALPGLGSAALLVPLAAACAALRLPSLRIPAGIGLAGAAVAMTAAALDDPALHIVASLALLVAAAWQIRRASRPAANDNVDNAPFPMFWRLPEAPLRATQPTRTSSPGLGE